MLVTFALAVLMPAQLNPAPLPSTLIIAPRTPTAVQMGLVGDSVTVKAFGRGSVFREFSDDPKVLRLLVYSDSPGATFFVVVVQGDKAGKITLSDCTITVEGAGPEPGPPGPKPPDLRGKLKAAFEAATGEAAQVKRAQLILLIGGYSAFADHAKDKGKVKTVADLKADLAVLGKDFIPNSLVEVRKAIAAELATVAGLEPSMAIDDARRAAVVSTVQAIVAALEALL